MNAIILVAGKGTRLRPLTYDNHKCLTEVNGQKIIENALTNLNNIGVKRVTLVIGYLGQQIKDTIDYSWQNMQINYVENKDYDTTNTSASLLLGLHEALNDDLLLLEGDVFFEAKALERLLVDNYKAATLLEKYNPTLDGSFVEVSKEGYVIDWVHKSARREGYIISDKYKTVNIHYFSKEIVKNVLLWAVENSVQRYDGSEPIEFVMRRIVQENPNTVKAIVLNGEKWFEIDDMNDLRVAEKIFAHN